MSRNLVNASRSLGRAQQTSSATYQQAVTDVRVALTAIEDEMAQLHFTAATSGAYLAQFARILEALGPAATRPTSLPPTNSPPTDGINSQLHDDLVRLSTALLGDTNQALLMLRSTANKDVNRTQMLRDIEYFYSQTTSFQQSLRVAMPRHDVRHGVLRLRSLAQGISRDLQQTGQVGWIAQRLGYCHARRATVG